MWLSFECVDGFEMVPPRTTAALADGGPQIQKTGHGTGMLVYGVSLLIADTSKTLGIILIVPSVLTLLCGMRKS
jgi:hypothetical protein